MRERTVGVLLFESSAVQLSALGGTKPLVDILEHAPDWIRGLHSRLRQKPADPTQVLEAEIAGLAAGLAIVEQRIAAGRAAADAAERTAMDAIRSGDHRRARSSLLEQQDQVENVATLEAEAAGLRALLHEARTFLAAMLVAPPSPPEDRPHEPPT